MSKNKSIPLRCRVFGHKWGAWIDGNWHEPNFGATSGALFLAHCKRCPIKWRDYNKKPGLSLEQLADQVRDKAHR